LEKDWDVDAGLFDFSGEIYAYVTMTLSNTGFSASAGCGIHVDGIGSLSLNASLYIDSGEFKLHVGVDIGICDVGVTVSFGSQAPPPAPPPTPILATQAGTILYLNLGADVGSRGALFGAVTDEDYELTGSGGNITVTALGY